MVNNLTKIKDKLNQIKFKEVHRQLMIKSECNLKSAKLNGITRFLTCIWRICRHSTFPRRYLYSPLSDAVQH